MAPVAQPNRAPPSEGGGRWFESSSEHQVRTAIAQEIESRPLLRARSSVRIRVAVPVVRMDEGLMTREQQSNLLVVLGDPSLSLYGGVG
jgi:hypothetical protein